MTPGCISPLPRPKAFENSGVDKGDSRLGFTTALVESFGAWEIRSDILYLDNGAFGACPTVVLEKQRDIRQWIEENPHDFFERSYIPACEASREALADFLHTDPADLVLLPGATHGLNVVIQSLTFDSDDEILTTNHAYSSVRLALEHVAKRDNVRLVVVDIPLEVSGPDIILQRILASVTPQTRFAVVDHVPSRSGLVFPIKEIVHELAALNIDTLVDGAHAPGMIPLNVADINAAYYVANCHKWMCTPRGVGFLHVRRDRVQNIKPLVIARSPYVVDGSSHSSLEHSFGWMGTNCPSALLSLPTSISFLNTVIPGGYRGLIDRNHNLAVLARRIICRTLGIPIPCPDSMIGAMATIPLPDSPGPKQEGMLPVQQALWREHGIVIPVYAWPSYPKRVIRLSVQAYNSLDQYLRLADCLRSVLYNERNPAPDRLNNPSLKLLRSSDSWGNGNDHVSTEYASACGHHADNGSNGADFLETPHQDIKNPTPRLLVWLAQLRVRRIVEGSFASYPVSLYPIAGDAETRFFMESKPDYGHANLEISRVAYMLSCIDQRRIPRIMEPSIACLMQDEDVVENWPEWVELLKNQAQILTRAITLDMAASQTPSTFPADASDFISRVVLYKTESHGGNLSFSFWLRALADFVRGRWSPVRVASFLQIHSFLKDPVGGLRNDAATQTELFILLFNELRAQLDDAQPSQTTWETVAAQLALESSFISQPLVRHTSYVHFSGDQQLVYSYVDINHLARSEFSSPAIVVGMIQNIINSPSNDLYSIAPIAVANSYPICSSHDARAVVIDGNNRITTVAFLRFVSIHGVPDTGETEELREYCQSYGLGPVYFVDLCAVMQMLWDGPVDIIDQLKIVEKVARFRHVRQVPVLITEESSFFTKVLVDGYETFLQPVHQCIFATEDLLVALPAKMQSHGRAKGFKALPIR
ncbi:hypothetical protein AAE478_010291 [Parahypoxylon ruwenzoriense]